MSDSNEEATQSPLIGDIIREAREKRNVSIKIVAQHTKISSTNLEALETNDFKSLPNKAYVKGYVKSCAKLLNLNEKYCLEILQANYEILEQPARAKEQKQQEKVKEEKENNELIFKMVGVIAVVIVLVFLLTSKDGNEDSPKESESVATEEVIQESTQAEITPVVLSNNTPMKEEATPIAVATPNPAPTPEVTKAPEVAQEKEKKEEKEEEEKKEEIKLRPITGTLYGFDSDMSEDQIDEWLPANYRTSSDDDKQSVFINATEGDTWLTYQADGGDIKKFILKKDQKLLITGEEVLLFLGNYKVTKIFLNNKPLEITSRSGVKSLVFPQEKASEHFYPLFIYKDDGSVLNSKTYNSSATN